MLLDLENVSTQWQRSGFCGRYLDKLVKRNNQWKIMYRQVVMDWCKRRELVDERNDEAFAEMAKGAYVNDDPLYKFLANK